MRLFDSATIVKNSALVYSFLLGVLMGPVLCDDPGEKLTVCQEEDDDLRVDCRIEPKTNYITDFEFSMSQGSKETVIKTNVSGTTAGNEFKHKTYVEELEPHGFRLTMMTFTPRENTTFMCKVTKTVETLFVEKDTLLQCSAVRMFLHSQVWLSILLFTFCNL